MSYKPHTTQPTPGTTFHIQAEEDKLSGLSKGHGDKNAMPTWVK
jgi:hypothetical protein